jgi:hypothetical protein
VEIWVKRLQAGESIALINVRNAGDFWILLTRACGENIEVLIVLARRLLYQLNNEWFMAQPDLFSGFTEKVDQTVI